MASPRLAALPLLTLLLVPPAAHAQAPATPGPAGAEVSLYAEASRHLGGGVRVDYPLGRLGSRRVGLGLELGGGLCGSHCLDVVYAGLYRPETGQLEPGEGLPGTQRPPGLDNTVLLPSLRASYHFDFPREGLLSLTDVYGLLLVGAAGIRSTYAEDGAAPVAHSDWAPTVGVGVGVRQLLGQRFFVAGELRGRLGSGSFGGGPDARGWQVSGPGLTLAAGLAL